ncbi:MAG: flagellar biosynthesis protein FlhA [Pirellulaceae bacterium]
MSNLLRIRDYLFPLGIMIGLFVILVPMPAGIMDVLLIANLAVSLIILLTAIYVSAPLEFSVFPTVLLATTLSRLVLNIATTRLILTKATTDGMDAAGGVIQSFGQYVAGNELFVGVVIFSIIAVIQFIVITQGATRISEVAARFTLDGLPGRQMAVDADLNAGAIDETEANRRRQEILHQADFYGAMDGASKFVRGDAIASVFITVINIVGGLALGILKYGMAPADALRVFSQLTIGDGLVSQVPALLISLAAGLLVTRSTQQVNLPVSLVQQLFAQRQVMIVAGVLLAMLAFTGLPTIPVLALGSGCLGIAFALNKPAATTSTLPTSPKQVRKKAAPARTESRIEDYLAVDAMEIELGMSLIRLADSKRGGSLLARIASLRQLVAAEMGMVLPKVRIRDNLKLADDHYQIKVNGGIVSTARIDVQKLIAIPPAASPMLSLSTSIRHPAFDRRIYEVDHQDRAKAEEFGCQILEPISVVTRHLRHVIDQHASELLTRDATRHLLNELEKTSPAIVSEIQATGIRLGNVQQVLRMLLTEKVPIRQLGLILEALSDHADQLTDIEALAEEVRHALARTICQKYRDTTGRLHVVTLDAGLEQELARCLASSATVQHRQQSELSNRLRNSLTASIEQLTQQGHPPVLLVRSPLRRWIRKLTADTIPDLVCLGTNEITADTKIVTVGIASEEAC